MKKLLIIFFVIGSAAGISAQVLFNDRFSTLTLTTDVQVSGSKTITTTYTNIPSGYTLLNDGFKNNVGSINAPNKPFNVVSLKTTGWAVVYNEIDMDTFLVSTSWLDTSVAVNRFVVSPVINNIASNSVLSWEAKSPDINFPDGYEVYVTTNTTGTLSASSFSLTDRVFTLVDGNSAGGGEKSNWTRRAVSLRNYAGQSVRIAFRNNSKNMYQLWLDDIKIENFANKLDAGITNLTGNNKYHLAGVTGTLGCSVTNLGDSIINSVTLNYKIGTIANYTQGFSLNPLINIYGSSELYFNAPFNISTPGYYPVKIWVSYVNGLSDQNHVNDTIYTSLCIQNVTPVKNVLAEQFLSATDGNSPDGQDKLIALQSSSVVVVNIHEKDSLKNSSSSGIISAYRKKTSSALIDRNYYSDINSFAVDRPAYSTRINQRKNALVPATVSIINKTYNSGTRELNFTVKADFIAETQGDYRINAYITENNVNGPGNDTTYNGWNQLSNMYNTPWSPYYQKGYYYAPADGYVLNGWQFKHQQVLDTLFDGAFGASGIVPTTGGTLNQSFLKNYTYTVPVAASGIFRFNPDNMYIVASISEFDAEIKYRSVLNCIQEKITANSELVGMIENVLSASFSIYPNPSQGLIHVLVPEGSFNSSISIQIKDISGKSMFVQSENMRFGILQLNLYHLESGIYFMHLTDGIHNRTEKLIIAR